MDILVMLVIRHIEGIMNISFTDKQVNYIASQVQSGDFQNASKVGDIIKDRHRVQSK